MTRFTLTSLITLLIAASVSYAQLVPQWTKTYPIDIDVGRSGKGLAHIPGEGYVITGTQGFEGTPLGYHGMMMWIDLDGNSVMESTLQAFPDSWTVPRCIEYLPAVGGPEQLIVSGYIRNSEENIETGFAAGLEMNGDVLWELDLTWNEQWGDDAYYDMITLPDRSVVAVGTRTILASSREAARVTRISDDGQLLWDVGVDIGQNQQYFETVALLPDGTLLLGGCYKAAAIRWPWVVHMDQDGQVLDQHHWPQNPHGAFVEGVAAAPDGDYYIAISRLYDGGTSPYEPYVLRVTPEYDTVWQWSYPRNGRAVISLFVDDEGPTIITQKIEFFSVTDYVFHHFDHAGNELWHTTIVQNYYQAWETLRVDGGYTMGGTFERDGYYNKPFLIRTIDNPTGDLSLELIPDQDPTIIPASGGIIGFTAHYTSGEPSFNAPVYLKAVHSSGQSAIIQLTDSRLMPTGDFHVPLEQFIPGSAPAGDYTLTLIVGLPDGPVLEASLPFSKQAGMAGQQIGTELLLPEGETQLPVPENRKR